MSVKHGVDKYIIKYTHKQIDIFTDKIKFLLVVFIFQLPIPRQLFECKG